MKNKRLLGLSAAFALTLAIGVTSCKKDKNNNDGAAGQLSATVGTESYKPSGVTGISFMGSISITGWRLNAQDSIFLQLQFPDTATVNSKLSLDDVADLFYYNAKGNLDYTSWNSRSHGTVTFSTFDKAGKKVAGSFSGVIYQSGSSSDSVVVKDGKFNTAYKAY
ncbi:MAG: hypothetical protein ACJ751_16265 [Niastella sp.]|uniref:hypothetical protein n=1 Tax=Niastella sp. TaxID=1869183 RepID=UPI003899CE66